MSTAAGPADDSDERLRALGGELAEAVLMALPAWAASLGATRLRAAGHTLDADDEDALAAACREAAGSLEAPLRELLSADVDAQWTTPLDLVRRALRPLTELLAARGIPAPARDRFQAERFPDDPYGLAPANLAALGSDVGELAIAWGAAKAFVHRARHGGSGG